MQSSFYDFAYELAGKNNVQSYCVENPMSNSKFWKSISASSSSTNEIDT